MKMCVYAVNFVNQAAFLECRTFIHQIKNQKKCNMCIDRIQSYINNGYSKKYYPACAKTCTADAIYFGPREEMVALAKQG